MCTTHAETHTSFSIWMEHMLIAMLKKKREIFFSAWTLAASIKSDCHLLTQRNGYQMRNGKRICNLSTPYIANDLFSFFRSCFVRVWAQSYKTRLSPPAKWSFLFILIAIYLQRITNKKCVHDFIQCWFVWEAKTGFVWVLCNFYFALR